MKSQRLAGSILLMILCTGVFWAYSSRPTTAQAQAGQIPKRCVGIATAALRSENPVITRVYRVFDDGTVETYDDGAPGAKWTPIGP